MVETKETRKQNKLVLYNLKTRGKIIIICRCYDCIFGEDLGEVIEKHLQAKRI